MHINYKKLQAKTYCIIILWICEVSAAMITDVFAYFQTKDPYSILNTSLWSLPFILSKLSYAYLVLLITLVYENLNVLNRFLKSVIRQNGYYVCEHFESSRIQQKNKQINGLSEIKSAVNADMIHFLIWQTSRIIGNLMTWSMPIICVHDFISITSNSYFLVSSFFTQSLNTTVYLHVTTIVIGQLANIVFIAHHCGKAVEAVLMNKIHLISQKLMEIKILTGI